MIKIELKDASSKPLHPNPVIDRLLQGPEWIDEPFDRKEMYINGELVKGHIFYQVGEEIYDAETKKGPLREENYKNFIRTGSLWES